MLACGMCVDISVFSVFPFAFYWTILFVLWSLVAGVYLKSAARRSGQVLPLYPHRYFLLGLGVLILSAPLTMGSVATPLFLVTCWTLYKAGRSLQAWKGLQPAPEGIARLAYRIQRLFLVTCVACIPMAYLRYWLQPR